MWKISQPVRTDKKKKKRLINKIRKTMTLNSTVFTATKK